MKNNNTFLVIGASIRQLPAIQKAKEMGLTVVCTDKNPNAPGLKLADFGYAIDILDKEATLKVAKKHNISGVMTMESDLPVPTIGYINDVMQLNGVSEEVANICSNKIETRKRLKSQNCLQPEFKLISTLEEATQASESIGFPCIIKAPDSSGSRGVTKVNNRKEIQKAFHEAFKYSRKEKIIVEEFVDGLEFGAQTFSANGKCEIVLLHSDILSPKPYMVPIGHSFPFTEISEIQKQEVIADIKKAINVLGIDNGPANVDFILDRKSGKIKIIEVGARIGATCLSELIYYHTGINWIEQTILNALNRKTDFSIKKNTPVTAFILSAYKDGILLGYDFPEDMLNHTNLMEYEITVQIGEKVNKLKKGTDRIGKVIFTGENIEDSVEKCLEFMRKTKIEINGEKS